MFQMATAPVLCLVRDLLFLSKITATAGSLGIGVKTVRDPAKLAAEAGNRLIVDLNQEGALAAAVQWRQRTGLPVIGFVSHVDTETITAARAAGIDRILARSAFVEQLPKLLGPLP
jgi:sugar/nucleoside kinase (ribokinase family)